MCVRNTQLLRRGECDNGGHARCVVVATSDTTRERRSPCFAGVCPHSRIASRASINHEAFVIGSLHVCDVCDGPSHANLPLLLLTCPRVDTVSRESHGRARREGVCPGDECDMWRSSVTHYVSDVSIVSTREALVKSRTHIQTPMSNRNARGSENRVNMRFSMKNERPHSGVGGVREVER